MVPIPVFRVLRPAVDVCLALALLAAVPALPAAAQAPATAQDAGPTEPLTIRSKSGSHAFAVEVMRDDASRARGLMFRRRRGVEDDRYGFEEVILLHYDAGHKWLA